MPPGSALKPSATIVPCLYALQHGGCTTCTLPVPGRGYTTCTREWWHAVGHSSSCKALLVICIRCSAVQGSPSVWRWWEGQWVAVAQMCEQPSSTRPMSHAAVPAATSGRKGQSSGPAGCPHKGPCQQACLHDTDQGVRAAVWKLSLLQISVLRCSNDLFPACNLRNKTLTTFEQSH